jgi:hypothetical protein
MANRGRCRPGGLVSCHFHQLFRLTEVYNDRELRRGTDDGRASLT